MTTFSSSQNKEVGMMKKTIITILVAILHNLILKKITNHNQKIQDHVDQKVMMNMDNQIKISMKILLINTNMTIITRNMTIITMQRT